MGKGQIKASKQMFFLKKVTNQYRAFFEYESFYLFSKRIDGASKEVFTEYSRDGITRKCVDK